jgi:predicted dehydrogenase
MSERLNWGILGTGNIARQFAGCVATSARGTLRAVASRKQASADAFAAQFHMPVAYGDYRELLADRSIHAVYIALPNTLHEEWTVQALDARKHVLCEKPFALDAEQGRRMFDAAEKRHLLLAEAFMYRSHPLMDAVRAAVERGDIGELRLIRSSFCYRLLNQQNIRFDPQMAGGVLMDLGCYCVNFSRLFARQEPVAIHAVAHRHATGIDDVLVGSLAFPGGILASFTCGMSVQVDNTAYLCGSEGYIEIPVPWKPPRQNALFVVARSTPPRMDGPVSAPPPRVTHRVDSQVDLFAHEADEFAAAVLDGKPLRVTPEDTLANCRVLDQMRQQISADYSQKNIKPQMNADERR